jgi:hypothetical protein
LPIDVAEPLPLALEAGVAVTSLAHGPDDDVATEGDEPSAEDVTTEGSHALEAGLHGARLVASRATVDGAGEQPDLAVFELEGQSFGAILPRIEQLARRAETRFEGNAKLFGEHRGQLLYGRPSGAIARGAPAAQSDGHGGHGRPEAPS